MRNWTPGSPVYEPRLEAVPHFLRSLLPQHLQEDVLQRRAEELGPRYLVLLLIHRRALRRRHCLQNALADEDRLHLDRPDGVVFGVCIGQERDTELPRAPAPCGTKAIACLDLIPNDVTNKP